MTRSSSTSSVFSSHPPTEDIEITRRSWEEKCLRSKEVESDPRMRLLPGCVVYYLHNHKTGGSTMCQTALKNGLRTPGVAENCNVPKAIRLDHRINIQELIFQKKWNFIAQEDSPLRLNTSNDRFVYLTTIRNPLDRLVSHIHHEFCGGDSNAKKSQLHLADKLHRHNCLPHSHDMTLSEFIADPCFLSPWIRAMTTDFYLAMLTGCRPRAYNGTHFTSTNNTKTCNRDHLEEAKKLLHYFSVIMISDKPEEFERYGEFLDLQFSITFDQHYRAGTHAHSDHLVSKIIEHNSSSREVLMALTSFDMELYLYAKVLAERQLSQASARVKSLKLFRSSSLLNNNGARRRLQPTHSAPLSRFPAGHQWTMSNTPSYLERPLC